MTAVVEAESGADSYACRSCGGTQCTEAVEGIRDWEYGVSGTWSYRRCANCSLLQIHPFPSIADLKDAYLPEYHGYRSSDEKGLLYKFLYEIKDKPFKRKIKALLPEGGAFLDIGCGSGEFLNRLKFLAPARLDGIDFNPHAVELAREKGIDAWLGIFPEFEAEPATYDAIFMVNYLEHTLNPRAEVEKAARLLKPGGALVGEVPNFRSLDQRLFGRYWGGNHCPRHTFQFEPPTIDALLSQSGFESIRTTQELSTNHFTLSVQNFLQRGQPDLRRNPKLHRGRAWYYNLLLIGLIPANVVNVVCRRSGVMKFFARRAAGGSSA